MDAVIRSGNVINSRPTPVKLGVELLVACPSYLARAGEPGTPLALVNHQLLRHRFLGRAARLDAFMTDSVKAVLKQHHA